MSDETTLSEDPIPFEEALAALASPEDTPIPLSYLQSFNGLEGDQLKQFSLVWQTAGLIKRAHFLENLEALAENDWTLSFEEIFRLACSDPEAENRLTGLRALWDTDDISFTSLFLEVLQNDADPDVRAQAATSLGHFVYLGEIDKIPQAKLTEIVDVLISILNDDAVSEPVQQRALESLGYSSHSSVQHLIEDAYDRDEIGWQSSALLAMGRSADERWEEDILDKLDHTDEDIQRYAAQAAGELEISDAVPSLLNLLSHLTSDVRLTAAWSLSQIGSPEGLDGIETLLSQTEHEKEIEFLQQALENFEFNDDTHLYDMLDIDPDSDDQIDPELDFPLN